MESKPDFALISLSKSQEVPQSNLRRSQRRHEKEEAALANSSYQPPVPLDLSLGLNRSQFLDPFGMDISFPEAAVALNVSQGIGMSGRLRSSKGGSLANSQSIKAEPLTKSQEISKGLRVSNSLNKADFPFEEESKPVVNSVPQITYDELKVLAEQLVRLPPQDLQAVLDFVRGQEPAVVQSQEDAGLQFDLGTLKPETLVSIKSFVEKKSIQPVLDSSRWASGKAVPRAAEKVMYMDMGSLECPECHKRFVDKASLGKHVRTHTGSKPFVCEQCNKSFRHSSTLKDHMNTHEAVRPYQCRHEDCGKRFSNMANLKRHERTHTDIKPFVCQFCQRPFNQSSNCKQHEKKCGGSTSAIKRAVYHSDEDNPAALKKPRHE